MRGTIISRQRRAIFAVSAIAALTAVALPAGAAAATRYVDDSGDADPLLNCTNPIDPCLSIDQGIGKASPGDTIEVGGGTYGSFTLSKAVDVAESNFNPGVTAGDAIVSGGASTAVTVTSGSSKLQGFTIRSTDPASQITVDVQAATTIKSNTFDEPVAPTATEIDVAIAPGAGSAVITGNAFLDPAAASTFQIGVQTVSTGSPEISGNTFTGLVHPVNVIGGGTAMVTGNTITGLEGGGPAGNGVFVQEATAAIVANLIDDPGEAGVIGIQLLEGPGSAPTGATMARNRVFDHSIGVAISNTIGPVSLDGDVIVKSTTTDVFASDTPAAGSEGDFEARNITAVEPGGSSHSILVNGVNASIDSSIVGSPSVATANGGTCTIAFSNGPPGDCGTFQSSVTPAFVNSGASPPDYHLVPTDPANAALIEMGNPATTSGVDLDGDPLALDFDKDCVARRDIGADEVTPVPPAPDCTPAPDPGAGDDSPPDTQIGKGPKKKSKKRKATFEFSSTEAGSSFQCSVDDGPFAPCSSPFATKVKKGKHEFEVRATDAAGNTDPTAAAQIWKVKKKRK